MGAVPILARNGPAQDVEANHVAAHRGDDAFVAGQVGVGGGRPEP